jgi:hypothetical protein
MLSPSKAARAAAVLPNIKCGTETSHGLHCLQDPCAVATHTTSAACVGERALERAGEHALERA